MAQEPWKNPDRAQRLAILGLWAIPGIGPKTLDAIRTALGGDISVAIRTPVHEWAPAIKLPFPVRQLLERIGDLAELAMNLTQRAEGNGISIAFQGDPAFPGNLIGLADAPPLLFYRGTPGPARRRVAMVGTRHPTSDFEPRAKQIAREIAGGGIGIVSGAAQGVDTLCHEGALEANGETWAFVGSALDELDSAQAKLLPSFLNGAGTFYTELPMGVRASTTSFPRRNRLISGAADAVLILRAGANSGALHTARAATRQGRPLLAIPGEPNDESAYGCNDLIRKGDAKLWMEPKDIFDALRMDPVFTAPVGREPVDFQQLSANARLAYEALDRFPRSLDEVGEACQMRSADLISGLCELELMGLIIQHPGKLYEKV